MTCQKPHPVRIILPPSLRRAVAGLAFACVATAASVACGDITAARAPIVSSASTDHAPAAGDSLLLWSLVVTELVACLLLAALFLARRRRQRHEADARLARIARQADVAQIASGVLHNVGNVLNSVNVSASMSLDMIARSKAGRLRQASQMLRDHRDDLAGFLTEDPKGKLLPEYLSGLADLLESEQASVVSELRSLTDSVEHVRQIINTQQAYAGQSPCQEPVVVEQLVRDAARINALAFDRHGIEWEVDCQPIAPLLVDKHRLLQILINLISNAGHALTATNQVHRRLSIRIETTGRDTFRIVVRDNGIGIEAANLERIFEHGYTRRKEGHGFGLHSARLAARQMNGSLTAHSDGPGTGASFVLELPFKPAATEPRHVSEATR